ncbi:hypothetical protein [Pedobacter caeni]|uniref:Uncharacterized protein n=1 Tax=Pedobacter caeni TaxID=288992 RepID=A0A1M4TS73_9SPHI|nr:hypothetical protein [Pedobacter caeni]SHE47312.1 hypothetical protein SAMN04488522_101299 [Pedobacter caeni]
MQVISKYNVREQKVVRSLKIQPKISSNRNSRTIILGMFLVSQLVLLFISAHAQAQKNTKFNWDLSKKLQHLRNREDSTTWSKRNFKIDLKDIEFSGKPMVEGVFPGPKYSLIGDSAFVGNGTVGNYSGISLKDKKIIYNGFFVDKSFINQDYLGVKPNEVFFLVVVLTDYIAEDGNSHMEASVSSRNYPDYIGQGSIKTKNNKIDFISFLTADRNNYAVVNFRLFDLNLGRVVLIAPQKDGSLRSMQLKPGILPSKEVKLYIKDLLTQKEVISFFLEKANI